MIDLHLHSTASDGRLAPAALVALAADAGLEIIAVTDHDTVAGLDEARTAARGRGLRLVDGIEITAVECGRDVHVLGYFFDPANTALARFLDRQRVARIERVRDIGSRLAALAVPIDVGALIDAAAAARRSIGRPALADALVAAGHAADRSDAFERWLGAGAPAFVERRGPSLGDVVAAIGVAGGIASLAHPGLLGLDDDIPRFAACGLDAIEVRHRDHDAGAEARYRGIAAALDLAVSGGSDFHGEQERSRTGAASRPGSVSLPAGDFAALESRARRGRKVNTGA